MIIIDEFKHLEVLVRETYSADRVVLHVFPSGSCELDVVISRELAVLQFSSLLKQFGIYSGTTAVELYSAETTVFEINEFQQAKDTFLKRLAKLIREV